MNYFVVYDVYWIFILFDGWLVIGNLKNSNVFIVKGGYGFDWYYGNG